MRVTRTFAFLDLSGFTAFSAEQGDEQAVEVLTQLRSAVRSATERRGVRLAKWLGDGAMLSGLEPATLIACALEAQWTLSQQCPLPLRAGICQGPVIMFEGDDYLGVAVNQAAKLCDAADPGATLVAGVPRTALPWWTAARRVPAPRALQAQTEVLQVSLDAAGHPEAAHDPVCGLPLLSDLAGARPPLFCSAACRSHWDGEQARS